ncbi:MAG: TIGR00730 family Rossman fold protein [Rhizobiaceae bacterium]
MNTIRSVCVYCGSSPGKGELYLKAGHTLGRSLAQAGLRLVYGGGTRGIMGAVSEATMRAGGKVTGIIPRFLTNKEATEQALARLDELLVTEGMHQRKHLMFEKSDAFVALPGGIGTLEEIVEIMTWGQLGHHRKPMVFVNIAGFWEPMLALLDHMRGEGFIHTGHLVPPTVVDSAEAVVPAILAAAAADGTPTEGVSSVIDKM